LIESSGQNSSTPLHFAAREGQLDIVKLLLDKGANVDAKDSDGDNPLQCAEINGHTKCAELLRSYKK
jgi:ankyrin